MYYQYVPENIIVEARRYRRNFASFPACIRNAINESRISLIMRCCELLLHRDQR